MWQGAAAGSNQNYHRPAKHANTLVASAVQRLLCSATWLRASQPTDWAYVFQVLLTISTIFERYRVQEASKALFLKIKLDDEEAR